MYPSSSAVDVPTKKLSGTASRVSLASCHHRHVCAGFAVFVVLTLSVAYAKPAPFQLGADVLLRWERRLRQYGSSGLAELTALEQKVLDYGRTGLGGLSDSIKSGAVSWSDMSHTGLQVCARTTLSQVCTAQISPPANLCCRAVASDSYRARVAGKAVARICIPWRRDAMLTDL